MNEQRVLIIMPVYNEASHLPRVLESIAAQTFDRERLYIIAVDGGSQDGSRDVLREWFTTSAIPGCIADNARRKIPAALNVGLRYARETDVVVRLDAHTIYGPTYIADALRILDDAGESVGCVGCAYIPEPGTTFSTKVVEALYTNPLGLGGAPYRLGRDVRAVDSAYLGVWPASVLRAVGGFDETLDANEDAELAARIRAKGWQILRAPLPCRIIINRGMLGTLRQWARYGVWRGKMLRRHPNSARARHVIACAAPPVAAVLGLTPLRLLLVPAFAAYAFAIVRGRAKGEPPFVTLASMLFFPSLQFAFGAGMLAGLVAPRTPARRNVPDGAHAARIES